LCKTLTPLLALNVTTVSTKKNEPICSGSFDDSTTISLSFEDPKVLSPCFNQNLPTRFSQPSSAFNLLTRFASHSLISLT
jgi:hypothetical protein